MSADTQPSATLSKPLLILNVDAVSTKLFMCFSVTQISPPSCIDRKGKFLFNFENYSATAKDIAEWLQR